MNMTAADLASDAYMLHAGQQVAVSTGQSISIHEPCSTVTQVTLNLLQYSHQGRRVSTDLQVLAEFLTQHNDT